MPGEKEKGFGPLSPYVKWHSLKNKYQEKTHEDSNVQI